MSKHSKKIKKKYYNELLEYIKAKTYANAKRVPRLLKKRNEHIQLIDYLENEVDKLRYDLDYLMALLHNNGIEY
jgi:hypothetical protein